MLRPRIIPFLLVHQGGLVKTVDFQAPKYVGDPINAVRIFNEKEADELIVVDIDATANGVEPDYRMIANLAAECRMPLCYGGGVRSADQAKRIIGLGVEKVAIGAAAVDDPDLASRIARTAGTQSVVVVLDVRKKSGLSGGKYELCTHNAKRTHAADPIEFAKRMEAAGAGEILVNSVDQDGQMKGYTRLTSAICRPPDSLTSCLATATAAAYLSKCSRRRTAGSSHSSRHIRA